MKVAIIGAGISGLACAHELERHGINPHIFEQRSKVGELFSHVSAMMELFIRPYRDPLDYLAQQYNLNLQPLNHMNKVTMNMPGVVRDVTGNLGYFFLRGQNKGSVEQQLVAKIKSSINYNVKVDFEQISKEYDYVVVCTGDNSAAKTLGLWDNLFHSLLRGGIVLGEFDPHTILMWFNKKYNDTGYAYLTPYDDKMASLTLIVRNIAPEELDDYWHMFWENEGFDKRFKIIESFTLEHTAGWVYPHQLGNTLFAGNAAGLLEPFLGFGQISALRSGVYAGRAIALNKEYENLLQPIKLDLERSTILREYLNKGSNRAIDLVTLGVTLPGIKQIIYNSNVDVFKYGVGLMKIVDKITGDVFSRQ